MPLHFVYGTSPRQLSHWVADHIKDQRLAGAQSCTWLASVALGPSEMVTPTAFLTERLAPFLTKREPISWVQILQLVKHILKEDRPFRATLPVARLLLDCKTNLVFAAAYQKLPAFLDKLVAPYGYTLPELYRAYNRQLSTLNLYDSGDVWELAFKAVREKTLVFPSSEHTLYWDRSLTQSPGERLWLKTLLTNYPNIAIYLTTPLSYRDPDDPFFMSAFHELGELAHTTLDLSQTAPATNAHSHTLYESAYQALCALAEGTEKNKKTAIVDRLPKRDRTLLTRWLDRTSFSPQRAWLDDLRQVCQADAQRLGITMVSEQEFNDYAEREWRERMSASLAPAVVMTDIVTAYVSDADVLYIPNFHADVFPPSAPLVMEGLALEPIAREWSEILRSTSYLYWQDRVLLRLIHERSSSSVKLLSSLRDLTGKDLLPSPFNAHYPVTETAAARAVDNTATAPKTALFSDAELASLRRTLFATPLSVAKLEIFAQCPFRFLMEVVLRLRTTDEMTPIPPALRGSVIHRVLELAVRLNQTFAEVWTSVEQEFAEGLNALAPFFKEEIKRDAAHCHHHVTTHALATLWQTRELEWAFEWPLSLPNGAITLSGRIDRIVESPETGHTVVIDYKTSARLPSSSDLLSGDALQLPLYLAAVNALYTAGKPAGAVYWNLAAGELKPGFLCDAIPEPLLDAFDIPSRSKALLSSAELAAWQERAIAEVNRLLGELHTTDFSPKPKDLEFCRRSCSWKRLCNYPWMEERATCR